MTEEPSYTAFAGSRLIASGALPDFLPKLKSWTERHDAPPLVFEDQTGRQVDFDLRGSIDEALARALPAQSRSGPGRPKLGVVSREISLLPRHWDWLEEQPNGASAALRRLVDDARKREPAKQRLRRAQDSLSRVLTALAGDLPGYEEAGRALYAGDRARFDALVRKWPAAVCAYVERLAAFAF